MRIAHTAAGMPARWWMTALPPSAATTYCTDAHLLADWLANGAGILVRTGDEQWLRPEMLSLHPEIVVVDARQRWLDEIIKDAQAFAAANLSYLDQCPPDAFTAGMPWVISGPSSLFDGLSAAVSPLYDSVAPMWFAGPVGSSHYLQAVFELCRYRTLVQWQAWMGDMQPPSPERVAMLFRQDRHLLQQLAGLSEHFLRLPGICPATLDPTNLKVGFAPQLATWCVNTLPVWLEAIP